MAERAAEAVRLGALRVCPAGCIEAPTWLAAIVVPVLLHGDAELCSLLE